MKKTVFVKKKFARAVSLEITSNAKGVLKDDFNSFEIILFNGMNFFIPIDTELFVDTQVYNEINITKEIKYDFHISLENYMKRYIFDKSLSTGRKVNRIYPKIFAHPTIEMNHEPGIVELDYCTGRKLPEILVITKFAYAGNENSAGICLNNKLICLLENYNVSVYSTNKKGNYKLKSVNYLEDNLSGLNFSDYYAVIFHFDKSDRLEEGILCKVKKSSKCIGLIDDLIVGTVLELSNDYMFNVESEYLFLNTMDKIIVTSEYTKKRYCEIYPEFSSKLFSNEHSFRFNLFNDKLNNDGKIFFNLMGTHYIYRKIDNILYAFDKFVETNPSCFLIVSDTNIDYVRMVYNELMNKENFIFIKNVSYEEAIKIEFNCSVFFNVPVDYPKMEYDYYIPGKLINFMQYGRPIINVSNFNTSRAKEILKGRGYFVKNETEEILAALNESIKIRNKLNFEEFHFKTKSVELDGILKKS